MKVLAIIPAYNEETTISSVIKQVRFHAPEIDIVVIDDGSTDRTAVLAAECGARVISLPYNLGIGAAVQTGYIYALENGYDAAVQVDGDGQHNPVDIKRLLAPIAEGTSDMVIGLRYIKETSYKSTLFRRTGMLFFSALISLVTGKRIADTTSGFRAVNRKIIAYFAKNYPNDYPEVDVLVKLHRKGFKVRELPVEMKKRQGGKSSITPLRSAYYLIKVSLAVLIGAFRAADNP